MERVSSCSSEEEKEEIGVGRAFSVSISCCLACSEVIIHCQYIVKTAKTQYIVIIM